MPTLILVRHGQSQWNLENRFTGWWDVDLTDKGVAEAMAAGELLATKGLLPTVAFTSLQTRAIKTLHLALEACGRLWIPETKDWRLKFLDMAGGHDNSARLLSSAAVAQW